MRPVDNADQFETTCFRRGHCEDLAHSQSSLYEILSVGEWNSKRFIAYLDKVALEDAVVMKAHADGDVSSGSDKSGAQRHCSSSLCFE